MLLQVLDGWWSETVFVTSALYRRLNICTAFYLLAIIFRAARLHADYPQSQYASVQ